MICSIFSLTSSIPLFRLFDHNYGRIIHYKVGSLADMVAVLQPSKTQIVKALLDLETPEKEIVKRAGASVRSVRRIKHNLRNYGTIRCPKTVPQGRKRVMTAEMDEVHLKPCFYRRI